jgi:hypothetical protein
MLNPIVTAASTRAQIADTDEAVLLFAVIARRPDQDVHPCDVAWWLALQERHEIRADLSASGLL